MPYKNQTQQKNSQKKYYEDNKEKYICSMQQRRNDWRQWLETIKQQYVCPCGESDPACLDFHHNNEKTDTIANAVRNCWAKDKILLEIAKCQVLCANCHRKLHKANRTLGKRRDKK